MKLLQNRKTNEVGYLYANQDENYNVLDKDQKVLAVYKTLQEVVEDWKDYEEPKETIKKVFSIGSTVYIMMGTEKEAEKAVKKLEAFARLRKNGFGFDGIREDYTRFANSPFRVGKRYFQYRKSEDDDWTNENWKDLETCFGSEE